MSSNESSTPHTCDFFIPSKGVPGEILGTMMQKEMAGDIPPSQDLGRFTTTKFDGVAINLMDISGTRNQACIEEYPSLARFQENCVAILANLWKAPHNFFGTATTGSSEAVLLGGLTMKRQWQLKNPDRQNTRPNVLIGANAHICVRKFADYFDVEAKIIPVNERTRYTFDVMSLEENLDGNTIGVFLTLGSTYTGHYDPLQRVSEILDEYERRTGNNIPIHVDAASGGLITPFTSSNETFVWDFRLSRVQSINVSGHKYGMAPLAVGWMIWREKSQIPQNLLLESSYLRGTHANFTLTFSRSGAPIAGQYYNFHRLGISGYRDWVHTLLDRARLLSIWLEDTGYFHCLSDAHRQLLSNGIISNSADGHHTRCHENDQAAVPGLPIVVFTFADRVRQQYPRLRLSDVSDSMHDLKFSIPSYTLHGWGAQGEDIDVMRIVLRDEMTVELMAEVLKNVIHVVEELIDQPY
ncbi:unnamed protein product [Penicillium glandicola]